MGKFIDGGKGIFKAGPHQAADERLHGVVEGQEEEDGQREPKGRSVQIAVLTLMLEYT